MAKMAVACFVQDRFTGYAVIQLIHTSARQAGKHYCIICSSCI